MRAKKLGEYWVDLDAIIAIGPVSVSHDGYGHGTFCFKLLLAGNQQEITVEKKAVSQMCVFPLHGGQRHTALGYAGDDGKAYHKLSEFPDGVKSTQQVEFEEERDALVKEWSRYKSEDISETGVDL